MDTTVEKLLGTISTVIGKATVRKPDGSEIVLMAGDAVYGGDQIIAQGGNISLLLSNGRIAEITDGQTLDLGNDTVLSGVGINSEGHSVAQLESLVGTLLNLPAPTAGVEDPVEQVIQQTEEDDPGAGEPPAAGIDGAGRFGNAALVEFGSDEVLPEYGFETSALVFGTLRIIDDLALDTTDLDTVPVVSTGTFDLDDQIRSAAQTVNALFFRAPAGTDQDAPIQGSTTQLAELDFTITSGDGVSSVVFGDVDELNAAEYTSAGELVVFELSPDGTVITATAGNYELMTFVLTTAADGLSGTITATINGQFDHPDPSGADQMTLTGLSLVVADGDDDTSITDFPIVFNDTIPEIGTPEKGIFDQASKDGFYVIPDSGDNYVNPLNSGSLDISWNADNTNNNEFPDAVADRSVVFDQNVLPQGLTSNEEEIQYEFSEDGTALLAYVGELQSDDDQDQGLSDEPGIYREIFRVALDDNGEGHYQFEIYDDIDYNDGAGNSLDTLDLSFGFIAIDADGDQASGSFVVSVVDTVQDSGVAVSEEGLKNSNPDTTPVPIDTTDSSTGSGEITFTNGGFTPGNFTVSWDESFTPDDITSGGDMVQWRTFNNELFGYLNLGSELAPVITITLGSVTADQDTGQPVVPYKVQLHRPIDHSDIHQEDVVKLQFGVTASTSNGSSTLNGTINVNVEDDSPVCKDSEDNNVSDEVTLGGSFGADGPGAFTFSQDQGTSQIFLHDGVTPVVLTTSADGSLVTGTYEEGGETKQALAIEITDAEDGTYQLVQQVGLDRDVLPISYVMTDKDGDSTDCNVDISILGSIPPVAVDNRYEVDEGASVSGNMITDDDNGPATAGGVDSDVDGGPLQIIEIDGNPVTFVAGVATVNVAQGSLEINQDGTFTYSHDGSEPGQSPESFTYTVSDGRGGSDTATVYLTVAEENDDPVAVDNRYEVDEGASVSGNMITDDDNGPATAGGVDSDVDGGPLQIIEIDGNPVTFVAGVATVNVAQGSLEINQDGTFTYSHDGSEPGQSPESFTYTVSDGRGGSDTATVYLTVAEENDDPVAVDNRYEVDEGASVSGNMITDDDNGPATAGGVDSDVDGGPLQIIEIDGNPVTFVAGVATVNVAQGSLEINQDGTFTYSHDGSEPGQSPESFTYTVSDGRGGSDTATVFLAVTSGNDAPNSQSFTVIDIGNDGTEAIKFVGVSQKYDVHGKPYSDGSGNYISDPEGQEMEIQLLSIPEHGKLIWNSPDGPLVVTEDMLQLGTNPTNFAIDSLSYEADPTVPRGTIIGDTGSSQKTEFDSWGIAGSNQIVGTVQIAEDQYIRLDAIGGEFDIPDLQSDGDQGGGLGIKSSTDADDADIDTKDEKIKVTFVNVVARSVTVTLDGLKGYFNWSDEGHQRERVELVVYGRDSDGNISQLTAEQNGKLQVIVDGSGNLHKGDNGDQILISNNESSPKNSTNLSRVVEISSLDQDITIDHIVIGIEGANNFDGSFEVRNIQLNANVDDSFNYIAVDSGGAESNESKVVIDTSGYNFTPLVGTSSDNNLTSVGGVNNTMSGLGGDDTFTWNNNSVVSNLVQHDVVTDFKLLANTNSEEKDILNLEGLLGSLITDSDSDSDKAGKLAEIMDMFIDNDNTILEFNDTNIAAPNDLTIILQGLDQQTWNVSAYGGTVNIATGEVTNEAELLEALISNGQLIV